MFFGIDLLYEINPGIIITIIGLIACCISIVFIVFLTKKEKRKLVVDEQLVSNLISFLGGKENIEKYSCENARVKFEVVDVNKVDFESLKTISENGVFITGNSVKTLFKYDSNIVIKMLDQSLN